MKELILKAFKTRLAGILQTRLLKESPFYHEVNGSPVAVIALDLNGIFYGAAQQKANERVRYIPGGRPALLKHLKRLVGEGVLIDQGTNWGPRYWAYKFTGEELETIVEEAKRPRDFAEALFPVKIKEVSQNEPSEQC